MREWESDPLFAAAEVVQDSADRVESLFRLLLHEVSLVQGDHPDNRILSLIEYHKRDLYTTLETAKWQLEDFEREVNVSTMADKSQMKQNVMTRHRQFIGAIREQIIQVEQSMENTSVGKSLRNMTMTEQDKDGLALFLSGRRPVKHSANLELEDDNILRRFLDPVVSSSSEEDVNEPKSSETESLNACGIVCLESLDHNLDLRENLTQGGLEPSSSVQEATYGRYEGDGSWDLEANEAKDQRCLQRNKMRSFLGRINIFGSVGNFLSIYGNRVNRSFTKRLKDGEELRQSPSPTVQMFLWRLMLSCGGCNFRSTYSHLPARFMQSCDRISDYREICLRSFPCIQAIHRSVLHIIPVLLVLLIIGLNKGQTWHTAPRPNQHTCIHFFPIPRRAAGHGPHAFRAFQLFLRI